MEKHSLKFIRQSMVLYEGKPTTIDVYQCVNCDKYCIINTEKDTKISLGGKIGEEI